MTGQDVIEAIRYAYDRVAPVYRAVNGGNMPAVLARLARGLVAPLRPGACLIDVGCGVGRDMGWFESRGFRVTGVDLSPAMLAQARGLIGGPLLQMDMRQLAFANASFDAAWCAASLLHLPKRYALTAIRAIRRVVRIGGGLMVSVQEGESESWAGGYVDGVERFFAYYTEAEMGTLLSEAGFTVHTVIADRAQRNWLSFLACAR